MTIRRFHAPTSREALAQARLVFGEDTLILSNRTTPKGVEVIATTEDSLAKTLPVAATTPPPAGPGVRGGTEASRKSVERDTEKLAMSTLSFQDYVRERMLRKREEQVRLDASPQVQVDLPMGNTVKRRPQITTRPVVPESTSARHSDPGHRSAQGIVDQLAAMKALIEEKFDTLTWLGNTQKSPVHSQLMLKLVQTGFSPALTRALLQRLPDRLTAGPALRWVMNTLAHNIKTDQGLPSVWESGGAHALVGTTGVGKTTTAAKLAAMGLQIHGTDQVALITLDVQRPAAHEQLRFHGRTLGVTTHSAHDKAALHDLLRLCAHKKLVLVDTPGVNTRDPGFTELLDVLNIPDLNKLLVLNAGAQMDANDDVAQQFKVAGVQEGILSKLDETFKLAPALDTLIRHKLMLRGVTQNPQVPEVMRRPIPEELVKTALGSGQRSGSSAGAADVNLLFAGSTSTTAGNGLRVAHA